MGRRCIRVSLLGDGSGRGGKRAAGRGDRQRREGQAGPRRGETPTDRADRQRLDPHGSSPIRQWPGLTPHEVSLMRGSSVAVRLN